MPRQEVDGRGVDALFGKKGRYVPEKTEIGARLDADTIALLDNLRLSICRDYPIKRSRASQSAIIAALIHLYAKNIDEIVKYLEK